MPTKNIGTETQKENKSSEQAGYGLYNPKNKSFDGEDELLDPQQIYDNSIQASETDYGIRDGTTRRREEPREIALDKENFGADFFQFDKEFRDNENGAPGIDEDYGATHNAADAGAADNLAVDDESMNLDDELPEATDRIVDRP